MVKFRIREVRKEKGWTLLQLSEAAGISKSQLARIEKNQSMQGFDMMCDIAHVLDVSLYDLHEYHFKEKNPQSG